MKRKGYLLWHPESPGMKVPVVRNWLQRLFYPKYFATLTETIKWYHYQVLTDITAKEFHYKIYKI